MTLEEDTVGGLRDTIRLAIENLPKPVMLRARNAFEGFDKARQLLSIDREIASFRAITAEEEAASALFRSLQLRNYPGAQRLNPYSHAQKAAVAPFIAAVRMALVGQSGKLSIHLTLDASKPSVTINILLKEFGIVIPGQDDLSLQLVEPLGLLGSKDDGSSPTAFYDKHFAEIANAANAKTILEVIKRAANARNTLLYASDASLPISKATFDTIEMRQQRADVSLLLAIAVLQVKTHQAMALQGVATFLKMVGKATEEDPAYRDVEPDVVIRLKRNE